MNHQDIFEAARQKGMEMRESEAVLLQYLQLIDFLRAEGHVVLLKWDGERASNFHTVMVTGLPTADGFIRKDHRRLEEALRCVFSEFVQQVWNQQTGDSP